MDEATAPFCSYSQQA